MTRVALASVLGALALIGEASAIADDRPRSTASEVIQAVSELAATPGSEKTSPLTPDQVQPQAPQDALRRAADAVGSLLDERAALDAEARTSKAAAKASETAAVAAEDSADKAKAHAADVKSGKLLEYGVTAGMAFSVQFPAFVGSSKSFKLADSASLSALPYAAFLPGYWSSAAAQNKYCASQWTGTSAEAQVAADSLARDQVAPMVDSLIDLFKATPDKSRRHSLVRRLTDLGFINPLSSLNAIAELLEDGDVQCAAGIYRSAVSAVSNDFSAQQSGSRFLELLVDLQTGCPSENDDDEKATIRTALEALDADSVRVNDILEKLAEHESTTTSEASRKTIRVALANLLALDILDWKVGEPAYCWDRKFGIFIGSPIGYKAEFTYGGESAGEFDVSQGVSAGLAFMPNAYVSILLGFSYATADVKTKNDLGAEIGDSVDVVQFSVSVGGSLDLLTLFKEL